MQAYSADRSFVAKVRRRVVRFQARRPARFAFERPIVSFSFDDIPLSAAVEGGRLLEAAGARGTFYVSAGLEDQDSPMGRIAGRQAVRRLSEAGHEIGCHTRGHLDLARASVSDIDADSIANADALEAWGVRAPRHFAYPYGEVALHAKAALATRFASLRALHPGLIKTEADLNQLPTVGVEGPDGEQAAQVWLQSALRQRAWLILYTHDVSSLPSPWGCTPEALAGLIDRARSGGADILPVGEVVERYARVNAAA